MTNAAVIIGNRTGSHVVAGQGKIAGYGPPYTLGGVMASFTTASAGGVKIAVVGMAVDTGLAHVMGVVAAAGTVAVMIDLGMTDFANTVICSVGILISVCEGVQGGFTRICTPALENHVANTAVGSGYFGKIGSVLV